jgi:DNA primase
VAGVWRENGDKDRVRDAADIVRVVGEVVALKPKGREYVGLCPFHDDHKPSMGVVPSKGIFHCFVCGSGGDVFSFVQKFHKMDFPEALGFLAEKFGVVLTPRKRAGSAEGTVEVGDDRLSRGDLVGLNTGAAHFFRTVLAHPEHGAAAREVVARRGISREMVEKFLVGASPDRWDGLVLKARHEEWSERGLLELGLLKARESGGTYDALRNRLIFPIQDQTGRVVAFGGRKINEEDEPKYLNSPETRLFDKSRTLYGLNHASRTIQLEKTAIITEGYTDVIACHQGGFTNAVATLGTALTREHATILRRLCDTVVLLFDGDEAGQRAADRAVEVFFAEPLDVKICTLRVYTDAKDPDELLKREGGAEVFRAALAGATDLLDYRFARLKSRLAGSGLSALAKGIDEEVARYVELGFRDVPPVRQALIVRRLSQLSGVDEGTIRRSIPAGRGGANGGRTVDDGTRRGVAGHPGGTGHLEGEREEAVETALGAIRSPGLAVSWHLMGCVLCDGNLWLALREDLRDLISPAAYGHLLLRELAQVVADVALHGEAPDLRGVLAHAEDGAIQAVAVGLHERIARETGGDVKALHEHWRECVRRGELAQNATASGANGALSLMDQIELKRKQHAALGGDMTILPRPM